jgi:hypothetical protein
MPSIYLLHISISFYPIKYLFALFTISLSILLHILTNIALLTSLTLMIWQDSEKGLQIFVIVFDILLIILYLVVVMSWFSYDWPGLNSYGTTKYIN